MSGLPRITVVTPVLNGAAHLEQTLASVRDQGYPSVEHVVVDGGSTDGTLDILRDALRVHWISEPDEGLADAVNKGFASARGDVLVWLNADDHLLPGALLAAGEVFAARPDAMWVTGRCRIIDGAGAEIRKPVTAYKNLLLRHHSLGLLLTQNYLSCPSTFLRREAVEEAGRLDLRYSYSMDYDLFLRIARRHEPVVLDRDLATFRMDEGSLSMSGFESQFAEHLEQARRWGDGHRFAVGVNAVMSRVIVLAYRAMRARRRLAS